MEIYARTAHCTSAATALVVTNAQLRGSAASFFDRMYVSSQTGAILEDVTEYGLVNDTLLQLQMDPSTRDGNALLYGFNSSTANESIGQGFSSG